MTTGAQRLIAIAVLMAGLWVTQAVPLAATSLLPLALFPLFGIQTAEETSKAFVEDVLFLYIGGMILALGIERWNCLKYRVCCRCEPSPDGVWIWSGDFRVVNVDQQYGMYDADAADRSGNAKDSG